VLQAKSFMTASEMGLALYTSLQGEAEAEAEHLDLKRINDKNGVNYILEELRGPLQQKVLFQKRKLLADFEGVRRHGNETVRQYVNRYRRIERDLQAVGIETSTMYDSEARGNRILERCQLSPDLQRLVMIGAGNSLDYAKITESMCLQFPDFKPTPPIWITGGIRQAPQQASASSSSSSSSSKGSTGSFRSSSTSASSGKGRFTGKGNTPKTYPYGKGPPRSVFQTEHEAGEDEKPDDAEDDEFEDPQEPNENDEELEPIPEGDEAADGDGDEPLDVNALADLAQVLTVTSRKLQASVLGRKFTNRKSIEERKRTSTCSACGQTGHWAGDAACSVSAQKRDSGGKGFKSGNGGSSSFSSTSSHAQKNIKKAYVVGIQHDQHEHEHEHEHDDEITPSPSTTYFSFTTVSVFGADSTSTTWVTETIDLGGFMVLDTACQRSCCGEVWLKTHDKILNTYHLQVKKVDATDHFQFGSGKPIAAAERAYFPVQMEGQETKGIVFGASVLPTNIPFLASRTLLERLGCIIDMFTKCITFSNLGVTLPLTHRHGHLAVCIVKFSDEIARHPCWKQLSNPHLWQDPDPELLHAPGAFNKGSIRDLPPQALLPADVPAGCARMAEAVGDDVPHGDDPAAQCFQGNVKNGEVRPRKPPMADNVGTHGRGGSTKTRSDEAGDIGQPGDVHSPSVPPLREHPRLFQPMQAVRPEVQMGPRPRRMATSWRGAIASFFALATALIFHNPGGPWNEHGQDFKNFENYDFESPRQAQGESSSSGLHASFGPGGGLARGVGSRSIPTSVGWGRGRFPTVRHPHGHPGLHVMDDEEEIDWWEVGKNTVSRIHNIPRKRLFNVNDLYQGDPCPVHVRRLCTECTVEMLYEDGRTQVMNYDWNVSGASSMKQLWTGKTTFRLHPQPQQGFSTNLERKNVRHAVRQAAHLLQVEHDVMMAGTTSTSPLTLLKSRPRVDLLETFAGRAGLTLRASRFGLKALQPIDYNTGYDLEKVTHQQHVDFLLDRFKPLFLVQGIDCKDWCLLQDNTNYVRRKILLLMRREKARKVLRRVVRWCVKQVEQGRYFLLENPATSRLWLEPLVLKLLRLPGVYFVVCHSGAYGGTNSKGQMIKKSFKFLGNCPHVLERLTRKLDPEQLQQCVPLVGKETTLSQHYPDDMIKQILHGIKRTAEQLDPERFQASSTMRFQVMAVNATPQDWMPVFESAQRSFDMTRQRSYVLPTSDVTWRMVQQLVQWHRLERVQIAFQPTMLRLPLHIPHTHRGWALLYNDQTVEVVEEDLADIRHPRAKFRKPVNIGVFFFGYAAADRKPDSAQPEMQHPQREPVEDDPQVIVASNTTGISFPKMPGLSQDIKTALSRLHRNLGHPHANELKKMLAMNGIKDQKIYDAIESLTCESCLRVKGPGRPEPAGIPQDVSLQFGDVVQMDLVYVRDITSTNHIFLGIIDECTHLHMALLLSDRSPEEVTFKFTTHWARPFGYPLKIKADPDGSFRGFFEESMDQAGTFLDYVPAENHSRIGLIERHNSTLRELMERTIDSRAVVGPEAMELAAVAACFAKNSCTWSSGRPPFVAAFGRVPRMGMNLLSDRHGLIAGRTREQAQREADYLRAEAQQHLSAMSVDSNLRRALLRKSTPNDPQELPVGSIAAYWRWTAKSGKKRGGFKLARVLGRDPDNKSMWLQAGTNTVKVSPHQVRPALGFEHWNPSYQDIKALRTAADNLQHGVFQDEQLPQPPEGQELPGFDEVQPQVQVPPPLGVGDDEPEAPGVELIPVPSTPRPVSVPQLPQQQLTEEATQTDPYQQTTINMNMSSPTYRQTIIQNQSFGMTEAQQAQPRVNIPVRKPHRSRSKTPARQLRDPALTSGPPLPATPRQSQGEQTSVRQSHVELFSEQQPGPSSVQQLSGSPSALALPNPAGAATPPLPEMPQTEVIEVADDDDDAAVQQASQQAVPSSLAAADEIGQQAPSTPEALKLTPAKRTFQEAAAEGPFDVSILQSTQDERILNSFAKDHCIDFDINDVDGITRMTDGFDGSPEVHMPYASKTFMAAYRKDTNYTGNGDSDESDAEVEDLRGPRDAIPPTLTRQEKKALDKEIPWQTILNMDDKTIQAYVDAAKAEEVSWMQFNSVRPVPREEARRILNDKVMRKRILRSRAAFRDKSRGVGPLKPKCRIVAVGCTDPDLWTLQRESATPTRQSEFLVFAIFIAGRNGKMMGNPIACWTLWAGDVKTAFLQGEPEQRSMPLFLLPPTDGICKQAKIFENATLLEVVGNIYGLASAPRTWQLHVVKILKRIGYQQSSLDKMLFYYYQKFDGESQPTLCAVVVVYVDDFLMAHDTRYDRSHLLSQFKWGSQNELSLESHLDFKGKKISLKYDSSSNEYQLKLDQEKFISEMKGGTVSKKMFKETLSTADLGEFRSVSGCLQWLAGQTRPDVAAIVSLCSRGAKSTYEDLHNMYMAVVHLHQSKTDGLILRPVPIDYSTMVVSYADSSWANSVGFASQHGALIMLASPKATDVIEPGLLVDWKSSRSTRVCRSTLAAEASAADMSVDRSSLVNYMLSELLLNRPAFHIASCDLLRMVQATDCRSLYDVLVSENPRTEDKRTIVTIRSAQQFLSRDNVFWIPTALQFADGLTKVSMTLMATFYQWLQRPWIQLHECDRNVKQQSNPSVKSPQHLQRMT
jgi:hypothetical protein